MHPDHLEWYTKYNEKWVNSTNHLILMVVKKLHRYSVVTLRRRHQTWKTLCSSTTLPVDPAATDVKVCTPEDQSPGEWGATSTRGSQIQILKLQESAVGYTSSIIWVNCVVAFQLPLWPGAAFYYIGTREKRHGVNHCTINQIVQWRHCFLQLGH